MCRVGVSLLSSVVFAALMGTTAHAAKLPQIKSNSSNTVPACVTPGRLMAFVEKRNGGMPRRFKKIAVDYMRHGRDLNMRWDQAFFQMLVETNYLKFKRGNGSWGDVRPPQNNFAGLGATGGGEPGESFGTVSDGVKAHLQHIMMYAGEHISDPVADRTRKVQSWGILDSWRDSIGRPLRFSDLTIKWSPSDAGYSDDIQLTADRFHNGYCNKSDPHPQWLAEAGGASGGAAIAGNTGGEMQIAAIDKVAAAPQRDFAREAIERGKRNDNNQRSGLGIGGRKGGNVGFKILNSQKPIANALQPSLGNSQSTTIAASGAAMLPKILPKGRAPSANTGPMKCNVFTASYGGQKALIIKAITNGVVNYTVLDVNKGRERREAQAYIAAYARGGTTVATYKTQNEALDKAFELCPEG